MKQPKKFDRALLDGDEIAYAAAAAAQPMWYYICPVMEDNDEPYEDLWFAKFRYSRQAKEYVKTWDLCEVEVIKEQEIQTAQIAKWNADQMIKKYLTFSKAKECTVFFSSSYNRRYDIATLWEYKGNRKDTEKPVFYQDVVDHIKDKYDCVEIYGLEADDVQGLYAYNDWSNGRNTVLVSKDKDLNMIPGWRLQPSPTKPAELRYVTLDEANNAMVLQLLLGDKDTDNIPGLYQLTGQRALASIKKWIFEGETFLEKIMRVYYTYWFYSDWDMDTLRYNLWEIGRLVWISRYDLTKMQNCIGGWTDPLEHLEVILGLREGQKSHWF